MRSGRRVVDSERSVDVKSINSYTRNTQAHRALVASDAELEKEDALTVGFVDDDDLVGEVDAERFARGLLQEEVVREEHELSNEGGSG